MMDVVLMLQKMSEFFGIGDASKFTQSL